MAAKKKATFSRRISSHAWEDEMKTLAAALALGLSMSMTPAPKAPSGPAVKDETRLAQAFADAEEDLEVRRSQLGLLGSAPFAGVEAPPAPKAPPVQTADALPLQ
jgi:hypothetical protein